MWIIYAVSFADANAELFYARTLVRRGPLKRQKFKVFVIDTSLRPPQVITVRSRDLLARFERGQESMKIYFKL